MRHFLRYGTHSEKDLFLEETDQYSYDAAVINANMLAYTPKAMAAFVLRLNKPFFIDPQTHAFQHGFEFVTNKNGTPKQSIKGLAAAYKGKILAALEASSSVKLEDFSTDEAKEELAKNVFNFQKETVHNVVTTGPEADYVNFALSDETSGLSKQNISPTGAIAPYFYINGTDDLALDLNVALIEETKKIIGNEKVELVAQLVVSKTAIADETFRKKIIEKYVSASAENIFLWVDDFDETEVSEGSLLDFRKLIAGLSDTKKVVNLYGGYFSILLTKKERGLAGVCHGMEYGEMRAVVPVGGGLPRAKYYFRPLHKRLDAEDFLRIISSNSGWEAGSKNSGFAQEVCDCLPCEDLYKFTETQTYEVKLKNGTRRGETSTSAAKERSLAHYLINKTKEFDFVEKSDFLGLIADLEGAKKRFSASAGSNNVGHIDRWIRAISANI